ncbi:MAG: hypothetical protein F8N37_18290 [Telmatospirillum sp.]|nr:hypothetical protein [Telmatospirillum sp.]
MSDMPEPVKLNFGASVEEVAMLLPRLTPGERAALRRMDDNGAGCPAFWHLAAKGGFLEDRRTGVWIRIVRIMASLFPRGEVSPTHCLHDVRRGLGTALCDGGEPGWGAGENPRPFLSEARLERFLATPDDRRGDALERILRPLAAHRAPDWGVNCCEIAQLLLFPATNDKLRAIARDYYRRKDTARPIARQEDVSA